MEVGGSRLQDRAWKLEIRMKVLSNSIYYIATATYNVTMTNLRAGVKVIEGKT